MFSNWLRGSRRSLRCDPRPVYLCLFAVLIVLFMPGTGQAEVSVAPRLVELTSKHRSTTLHVINTGDEKQTYRITLRNYAMDGKGQLAPSEMAQGEDRFADKLIRYSPRQVTLNPGEMQMVRVMFRRSTDLQPGEYRSHLMFSRLPKAQSANSEAVSDESKLAIKIDAIFGITIPVIIYHGDLSASAELTDLDLIEMEKGDPALSLQIKRDGNRSLRGNLSASVNGEEVARINNLTVYMSTPSRHVVLPLALKETHKGQTLVIEYRKNNNDGGALMTSSEKIIK